MLICVGEILVDMFIDASHKEMFPGGAPFNVACNSLLYTDEVSFVGSVGNDDNGKVLIDFASKKGFKNLHLKVLDDRYTTRAIVTLVNGERSFRFERDFGADYILDISDIDIDSIKDKDIIHIGSLMLSYKEGRDFYFNLVKEIKENSKAKISFDINYRDDIFSSSEEAKEIFKKALKMADILKFSIEELTLFSNKENIEDILKDILNDQQIALITLGKDGSIFYHNGEMIKVDTFPIQPVDTTGAGDAFYSYFLASLVNNPNLINDKEEIINTLRRANVVGALATQKKGAIGVAPSKNEIDAFLIEHNK